MVYGKISTFLFFRAGFPMEMTQGAEELWPTELKIILKDSPISQTVESTIRQVQAAITIAIAASTAASTSGR